MVKYTKNTSLEEKRKFGKFETPKYIARFIVKWAIRKGNDLILDPCVGSGILLFEAIQQLEQFCAPSKALKNVYGADIDSVAVENVVKKLRLDSSRSSNIICVDFLTTNPSGKNDAHNCKGMLPLVDVVVCNPPYTRHQHAECANTKTMIPTICLTPLLV